MPDGWNTRVERYIDEQIKKKNARGLKYFLLEALTAEYVSCILNDTQLDAIQRLLAHLLTHGGFVVAKTEAVLIKLRQNRVRLELLVGADENENSR